MIKKAILTLAALIALGACSKSEPKSEAIAFPSSVELNETIALVNGIPVMGRDLLAFAVSYQPQAIDSTKSRLFNLELLNAYIDRVVLSQQASGAGIVVPDSMVSWFVNQLYNAMGQTVFANALSRAGLGVGDVEKTVRLDLRIRRYMEAVLATQVNVGDDEAREFYDANPELFAPRDSVHARHILVRSGNNMVQRANVAYEVRQRAANGEDFAELAKQYSEGPSGPNGGDLGWFAHRDMVPAFADAAFALKVGEISDVVQTEFGFHVIQVLDRKTSKQLSFEEARPSILASLRDKALNDLVQNSLRRARAAAIIEPKFDIGGLTQRESATFTR